MKDALSHLPFFKLWSACGIFLAALRIREAVSSTTEIIFALGAFVTAISFCFANSRSMLSTPTPHLAIILIFFPNSKTSLLRTVPLLITTISESTIFSFISSYLFSDNETSKHSPSVLSSSKTFSFN